MRDRREPQNRLQCERLQKASGVEEGVRTRTQFAPVSHENSRRPICPFQNSDNSRRALNSGEYRRGARAGNRFSLRPVPPHCSGISIGTGVSSNSRVRNRRNPEKRISLALEPGNGCKDVASRTDTPPQTPQTVTRARDSKRSDILSRGRRSAGRAAVSFRGQPAALQLSVLQLRYAAFGKAYTPGESGPEFRR